MQTPENPRAHPPETLEGWYAQHQIFTYDRNARGADATPRVGSTQQSSSEGWTIAVDLIGSKADLMVIRFAPTLDAIGEADRKLRDDSSAALHLDSSFLSVTEAGLYHLTAELARDTVARGGKVG